MTGALIACGEGVSPLGDAGPTASSMATSAVTATTTTATSTPIATTTPTATTATGGCPSGMVVVSGGKLSTLERGADVEVAPFCLDEVEVTVARFRAEVEAKRVARECADDASCPPIPRFTAWPGPRSDGPLSEEDATVSKFCNGQKREVETHPVNCVSIGEARSYCAANGARLPTGDEWEWAAHGAEVTPWGTAVATNDVCWGKPHKRTGTCESRSLATDRTKAGVFDLGGNVSEWVEPPHRAASVPTRWAYGASWYAIDDGYVRAALGGFETPAKRAETIGFRCAATLR